MKNVVPLFGDPDISLVDALHKVSGELVLCFGIDEDSDDGPFWIALDRALAIVDDRPHEASDLPPQLVAELAHGALVLTRTHPEAASGVLALLFRRISQCP